MRSVVLLVVGIVGLVVLRYRARQEMLRAYTMGELWGCASGLTVNPYFMSKGLRCTMIQGKVWVVQVHGAEFSPVWNVTDAEFEKFTSRSR